MYSRANSAKGVSIDSYNIFSKRPSREAEGVIHIYTKKETKKELFTIRGLQTHSYKEYVSKASGEDPYYTYSKESRGGDIIIIKLNRRKKTPLYSLSDKSSYGDSSDSMKD